MMQNSFHGIPAIANTSKELISAMLYAMLFMHFLLLSFSLPLASSASPYCTDLCIIYVVAVSFGVVLH